MTINALKKTILYDEEVFRWAVSFLATPSIRHEIPAHKAFPLNVFHFTTLLAGVAVSLYLVKMLLTPPKTIDIWIAAVGIVGTLLLEILYKRITATLIAEIILSNYSTEDFKEKTLLQLGGMLEKRYGALPMVDSFFGWAMLCRKLLAPFVILILFLSFFSTRITVYTIIALSLWVLHAFSRTPSGLRFLSSKS